MVKLTYLFNIMGKFLLTDETSSGIKIMMSIEKYQARKTLAVTAI